jgi:hypothetical protein
MEKKLTVVENNLLLNLLDNLHLLQKQRERDR